MTPTELFKSRWLCMALSAAALTACGGGGSSAPAPQPAPAPAPLESTLNTARSGELLGYVKQRLQARGPLGSSAEFALSPGTPPTTPVSKSGTVVQEAGVDEADLIKTDGSRLYSMQALPISTDGKSPTYARLHIHTLDAQGLPQPAGGTDLTLAPGTVRQVTPKARGLLLADGLPRLAAVAESSAYGSFCPPASACFLPLLPSVVSDPQVHLSLHDVSQPAALPTPTRLDIEGRLISTRQIGRTIYVVATHSPRLAFDKLPGTASAADRQAALDKLTVADVLPRIRVDGGTPQPLVNESDCWLQPANASRQIAVTTITAIDLSSPTWARSSRCFVGGTEALYMARDALYLATTRHDIQTLANNRLGFAPETRTDIHKFAVSGSSIAYRASGFVLGHLGWDRERTAYRLSEFNGDLRVLTFTGVQGWVTEADAALIAASPATLTVLRERSSDASLVTVATLPNAQRPAPIGKAGEQVYAVRFTGDRAYVVTFRQADPLYVLDLSNPADPRTVGELQMPGFSDWLFPLDGGLLFGVGKDADAQGRVLGVKLALFDVRDAARPQLQDSRTFGQRGSVTALDYDSHGIGLQVVGSTTRLALPMSLLGDVSTNAAPLQQVQRLEVDSAARTLTVKSPLALDGGWIDMGSVRALLLGDRVHVLRDGTLSTTTW